MKQLPVGKSYVRNLKFERLVEVIPWLGMLVVQNPFPNRINFRRDPQTLERVRQRIRALFEAGLYDISDHVRADPHHRGIREEEITEALRSGSVLRKYGVSSDPFGVQEFCVLCLPLAEGRPAANLEVPVVVKKHRLVVTTAYFPGVDKPPPPLVGTGVMGLGSGYFGPLDVGSEEFAWPNLILWLRMR